MKPKSQDNQKNIHIYMAEGIVVDLPGMVEIAMYGGDRRLGEIRFSIHF